MLEGYRTAAGASNGRYDAPMATQILDLKLDVVFTPRDDAMEVEDFPKITRAAAKQRLVGYITQMLDDHIPGNCVCSVLMAGRVRDPD